MLAASASNMFKIDIPLDEDLLPDVKTPDGLVEEKASARPRTSRRMRSCCPCSIECVRRAHLTDLFPHGSALA